MAAAVEKAQEITNSSKDAVMLQQFNNPANAAVHKATTGPEIWRDTAGKVDVIVCGVGTGGTITGAGEYLKEKNPKIQVSARSQHSWPAPLQHGRSLAKHCARGLCRNSRGLQHVVSV